MRLYIPFMGWLQPTSGIPYPAQLEPMDRGSTFRVQFGLLLRRLMKESADAQTIVALHKKSKIAKSTIDRATRGEVAIGIDKLPDLARAFGMKPWELLKALDEPLSQRSDEWTKPLSRDQRVLQKAMTTAALLVGTIPDPQANAITQILKSSVAAGAHERAKPKSKHAVAEVELSTKK